jgi:hypothetical protein
MAAPGIAATLDNFEFDLKYNVVSYNMIYYSQGYDTKFEAKGPALTPQMVAAIRPMRRGQQFYFTDIKAVGPDKITRDLPPIALTIK